MCDQPAELQHLTRRGNATTATPFTVRDASPLRLENCTIEIWRLNGATAWEVQIEPWGGNGSMISYQAGITGNFLLISARVATVRVVGVGLFQAVIVERPKEEWLK